MQTSGRRKVIFNLPWDDAPIDIRHLFAHEAPAGKHGFLQCKDGRMVFEDGTEARFWGTNFNSVANFPPHHYSEKVALRLAKFGVNLVRLHQMDGEWSTPNIFQFTKGPRLENTRKLDPQSMDRLDYLIHCLKEQGIYIYMDLLTYRRFRSGDGVEAAADLPIRGSGRPYSNFDRRMIELQKEFCDQIWNHVNPYTKLAYKDDPAIALTEVTNESEMFVKRELIEPYRSQLEERYLAWREKRDLPPVERPVPFFEFADDHETDFMLELQTDYFDEMRQYMLDIGVKIPITGTNWAVGGAATLVSQKNMDFMDSHTYFYNWGWKPYEKRVHTDSMLAKLNPWYSPLSAMRTLDRPFFVSEWDMPWPNEWRAESVLNLAAVSALQGWSGTAIHTYRYDNRERSDMIALPVTSDALAGVPYRSGVFDTFNDPAKFGLFYHAAIILRRGDVKEAVSSAECILPGIRLNDIPSSKGEPGLIAHNHYKPLDGACEVSKVGVRLPGAPAVADRQMEIEETLVDPETVELRSDTGELCRNISKRYATIDTPRTKVAYGLLGKAGVIELDGLRIESHSDFGVVALSSLSEADLADSDNILLTAVGRADNSGTTYNSDRSIQYNIGHPPILAEVVEVSLELTTNVTGLLISGINSEGLICGPVESELIDGRLCFRLGGDFPTIYYLIQKL